MPIAERTSCIASRAAPRMLRSAARASAGLLSKMSSARLACTLIAAIV
jgi:hypothetical protein